MKTNDLHMRKKKTQISCVVTTQLVLCSNYTAGNYTADKRLCDSTIPLLVTSKVSSF